MTVTVKLTSTELAFAGFTGVMRQISALQHRRSDANGKGWPTRSVSEHWGFEIDGAAAEMAVAKYLGRYWRPLAERGRLSSVPADIGENVQVRSTRNPAGPLIVHPRDDDAHVFVLVITRPPCFDLIGWLYGREAKRDEWWFIGVPHPAFFADQCELHDIAALDGELVR